MGAFQAKEGVGCKWVYHAEEEAGNVQTCYQNCGTADFYKKTVK